MSQLYKNSTGVAPPGTVGQLTPDTGGVVTPVGNNIDVFSANVITNNTLGIQTANGGAGELDIRLTNRVSVSTTTSDGAGQVQTITVLTTSNSTAVTFYVFFVGIDVPNNVATGSETIGICRTSAGTVTIIGINDVFSEEDAALAATSYQIIASGADLQLQFTGIAGRTINWRAVFEYVQAP